MPSVEKLKCSVVVKKEAIYIFYFKSTNKISHLLRAFQGVIPVFAQNIFFVEAHKSPCLWGSCGPGTAELSVLPIQMYCVVTEICIQATSTRVNNPSPICLKKPDNGAKKAFSGDGTTIWTDKGQHASSMMALFFCETYMCLFLLLTWTCFTASLKIFSVVPET